MFLFFPVAPDMLDCLVESLNINLDESLFFFFFLNKNTIQIGNSKREIMYVCDDGVALLLSQVFKFGKIKECTFP